MGLGLGSLVFTALLWPNVAAAAEKGRDFIEATERKIFLSPGVSILGSLSHFEPSLTCPVCICNSSSALKIC